VKAITEELVGHSFSASSISAIVKKLDGELSCFARRRLEEPFPYLVLDARYEKVRVDHVIHAQAVLIAVGIDWEGRRQILGVELSNRESRSSWRDFLTGLKERGLHGIEFVVSDDHDGLKAAIRECLPEGAWQRCCVHFLKNAIDHLPRKRDDDCLKELGWLYERRNIKEARADLKARIERGPRPLSKPGGMGRGEHRGDVDVLFAAAGPPQEYEIDEHAGAIQRGDQTPHSRCSNLPQ
jgi:transposase-like protein